MISTLKSKFTSYLNHYSVAKTRHLLLGLDDDLLQQASISRDLLQRGVDYWPWQITENQASAPEVAAQVSAENSGLKSVTSNVAGAAGLNVEPVAPLHTSDSAATAEKAA